MVSVVCGPSWFVTVGVVIGLLSAFAAGLVATALFRYSVIARDRRFLHLGSGFALLAVAFVGRALLSFGLHAKPYGFVNEGVTVLLTHPDLVRSIVLLFAVLAKEFLLLFGLFLIFSAYHDVSRTMHAFVAFLLVLLLWFAAKAFYVFHLVALVLVLLITTSLIARYFLKRKRTMLLLAGMFGVLVVSQFMFFFAVLSPLFYVFAELLQLVGILLLLAVYVYLMSHGKKIAA